MASKEQSVTLLRRNKEAVVEGLGSNGYTVDENLRMSDVARLIRMGAALLDITVACVRVSDGQEFFLTVAEWQNLTNDQKGKLVRRGLRVRAYGDSFIIAADSYPARSWGDSVTLTTEYKAFTQGSDGMEDTGVWSLPTLRMAQTFYMHRDDINAAMTAVWSADMNLSDTSHWTSQSNGSQYFFVNAATGAFWSTANSDKLTCRPVCKLQSN